MRKVLLSVASFICRTERYFPVPEWSSDSLVFNLFRLFEQTFGRKYGIRRETFVSFDGVNLTQRFFTLEAKATYIEGIVIAFFKSLKPRPFRIYIPTLVTTNGIRIPASPFLFAIAYDNSGGNATGTDTTTFSLTVAGSDRIAIGTGYDGSLATLSVMSYGAGNFTQIASSTTGVAWKQFTGYLIAPATGSNTFTYTGTGGFGNTRANCATYSGVAQTGQPDAFAENHSTGAVTTLTWTTTVVANNSWLVLPVWLDSGGGSAGSGTFERFASSTINADTYNIYDSNGTVAAGSRSLIANFTSTAIALGVIVSIAPAATPPSYDVMQHHMQISGGLM